MEFKGKLIRRVAISNYAEWDNTDYKWLLALVSIEDPDREGTYLFFTPRTGVGKWRRGTPACHVAGHCSKSSPKSASWNPGRCVC